MPRQEHLSQVVGAVAFWRRLHGPRAGPVALIRWFQAALLACWLGGLGAAGAQTPTPPVLQAEAAPAGWDSQAPPSQGWTPVTLPDIWSTRWPAHDGVTWYRLRWDEAAGREPPPRGLRLDSVSMAAVFYVNGHEIGRDLNLVEPLSRAWNLPRYWRLEAPLLRPGANEIVVRVSGLSAYQPGLGAVRLGPPEAMLADYERREFHVRSVHWVGLGLALVMGTLFGMLWALRRSERSYGWFSLFSIAWALYSWNHVARSPSPFSTTPPFQEAILLLLIGSVAAFTMFALELAESRGRRPRRALGATAATAALLVVAVPGNWEAPARSLVVLLTLLIFLSGFAVVVRHAFRTRRTDLVVLACSLALPLVAATHDTLLFMNLIPGDTYFSAPSAMATLLGSSFALTWRMVQGMRMIEHFNVELQQRVDEARRQLAENLASQHEAALVQTRLAERMNMVRDLHDGLGMTLSSHMHALRGGADGHGPQTALAALQEVSDDLRLIIETSSFEDSDALPERLAPLRHRATRLLEAAGIEVSWSLENVDGCSLESRRSLDFMRVLQEALANALKHSGATSVHVSIAVRDGQLALSVTDDGRGIPDEGAVVTRTGIGMQSMRTRAARLQGTLSIRSGASGTRLELHCPVAA